MMEQVVCVDTAALVAVPVFPNSVRWSEENLLAAAAGHLVTILDPSSLAGPRGYITLPRCPKQDIGEISDEDSTKPSLFPLRLRKETQTHIRSIDWSPQGFAPDAGCLLAVCTSAHDVRIFRRPISELTCEWIEVANISALFHGHCAATGFAEAAPKALEYAKEDTVSVPEATWQFRKGWQTKSMTKRRNPNAKTGRAPKSKKSDPAQEATQPSNMEGAFGENTKEGKAAPETEKSEGATLSLENTAGGAGAREQGAAQEADGAKADLVEGGKIGEANAETEGVKEGEEPRFAGATDHELGSFPEGRTALQNDGLGSEHHGNGDGSGGGDRGGTREGLILRPDEARASDGAIVTPEGQRTGKLKPRGEKGAPRPIEGGTEGLLFEEEFPDGVRLTDMLMGAETGEAEGPVESLGGVEERKADGAGESRESPSSSARKEETKLNEVEKSRGVAQFGNERETGAAGLDAEPDDTKGRRGRKRARGTESAGDASPRVTRRRSTRQRVEGSRKQSQGDKSGDGSAGGYGIMVAAAEKGGRKKKRGGLQTEREAAAVSERAQGATISAQHGVAPAGEGEAVPGEAGGSEKEDAAKEADGGLGEKAVEAGGGGASLWGPLDAAQTGANERRSGTSSVLEDRALGSLSKPGCSRDGSSVDANGPGGSPDQPPGGAEPPCEPSPRLWRLGSVTGPVLLTDAVGVGSRVEVLQTEVGLAGAWFAGTVVSLGGRKKAQVEYDELLENEETGEKLREWIPLQPVATVGVGGLAAKPAGKRRGNKRVKVTQRRKRKDETAEAAAAEHSGTSKTEKRPRVRPETSRIDKDYAAGDHVEVFIDDAWWEGLVVGCKPGGEASVYFPGDGDVRQFEPGRLRLAWGFRGLGRGWAPFGSTAPENATKPVARRRVTKKVKEELAEDAPTERRKKGVKVGGKRVRIRKKTTVAEPLTTGGLKLPKVENEGEYEFATLGREERARLVREHERLGGVLCERFRVLREVEPAEALPEYQEWEHLKGRDKEILEQALAEMVAQEGDQLGAARLTVKELVKLGRQHIRRKVVVTKKPKPKVNFEPATDGGAALGPRKRKRINYATLGGDDEGKEEQKAESSRKGKRRKQAPVDEDEEFQTQPSSESDSDSDAILATKKRRKKSGKRKSKAAIERNREQSRQRYGKKREATKAAKGEVKRLAKAKIEHAPGSEVIPAATFAARSDLLAALTVAWSPTCHRERTPGGAFTVLAVGSMSGHVALWKVGQPLGYGTGDGGATSVTFLGTLLAHDSWVSALGWAYWEGPVKKGDGAVDSRGIEQGSDSQGLLLLGTGSSDGSVRLWFIATDGPADGGAPLVIQPAGQVCVPSGEFVSSLSVRIDADVIKVAAARGAGELLVWQGPVPTRSSASQGGLAPKVTSARPSGQPLMGLGWAASGEEVFTCSQEGGLQRWQLDGVNTLLPFTLELTAGDRQFGLSVPTPGLMRGYTGLALSPNGLAIAGVRTLALGALDAMYQAKAMRGALQVSLCGRGGVKPELGKRPRGKLSATAEAAIQALAAGREKPPGKRDWLDEFLTPADANDEPGDVYKGKGKEGEEEEAQVTGKAVGEDSRAEDEWRQSAVEKLRREVVRSVERILRSGRPLVLWDVLAALREFDADALRQVLTVVRRAARGAEPGRGTTSSGGLRSAGDKRIGSREDEGSARGKNSEHRDGMRVESSGARVTQPELRKGDLQDGGSEAGADDGLWENQEGEAATVLLDGTPAVGNGDERFSPEAEGRARRALQVLHVLLLKLGASLDPEHGDEDRTLRSEPPSGAGVAGRIEPSTARDDFRSVGLVDQGRRLHPEGKEWETELRQVETELRVRLAESLLARLNESAGPVTGPAATSALLWADWARTKGAPAGPRLLKLAEDLNNICGIRLPAHEAQPVSREVCPFCSSPVPLDSPDTAYCSQAGVPGTSTRPGVKGHKFKRCMATMLIQSSPARWQCSCCLRIRTDSPFDSERQPLCGLCGVLMHRPLPEPFLRPALCC